jgi:hypothetical protein
MPTKISEQKGKELSKSLSSLLRTASTHFDGNARDDGCVWKAAEVAGACVGISTIKATWDSTA